MSQLSSAASEIKTIKHLEQFHGQLVQNSLHRQNYWVALLINLCTRLHAPLHYARRIFYSTLQPNGIVVSNMLKYFFRRGAKSDFCSLFDELQKCGIRPDKSVYPVLIKSAGKDGIVIHGLVMKLGLNFDLYIRNAVLDMYGKLGCIDDARQLFDEMSERSIADWNSMISGYWNWGNEAEARRLFELMPKRNVISWTAMVTGYTKRKDLRNARKYFDEMPERNVISWNAMLSGYAQNGFSEEAITLYCQMVRAGFFPDETTIVALVSSCSSYGDAGIAASIAKMITNHDIQLNCYVKTSLLDMYAKCGNLVMARKIFDELGVDRNCATWNAMISAHARCGDLDLARQLFDTCPEKDIVTWNSMIAGYAQNGQSKQAIDLFQEMIDKEILPDEITLASVIAACGHLGALKLGSWVVGFAKENQITLGTSGSNSLIFMYSKCGSMRDAENVFQALESKDLVSYNTLITGFAASGHGTKAINLLNEMKAKGIEPNKITYVGVLTACSHSGLTEQGLNIFESIEAPDVDQFACMVDLLGRKGKLDEAKRMVEGMPMPPHAGVYGSLLNASWLHKSIELGEFAASKLFELEPENSGNYVLLCNIYASAGRWKDVDRVREMMTKRGVKKTTGGSWVEHDGKVHKFTAGDRSHQRTAEIYGFLAEMKKKMRAAGYIADKTFVSRDVEEEEKEEMVETHSEKLAIAFAILVSEPGSVIKVVKNLRVCLDCHVAIKLISKLEQREIVLRDNNRFHSFHNGECSCGDYW